MGLPGADAWPSASTWSRVYLERSRPGYQLAGVREDEDAAEALGIPCRRLKVAAVAASAALTSVCGGLWAQYVGFVDPFYVFSVDLSVRFALNSIIGGLGTALGPFVGSLLITSLETYLRATFSDFKAGLIGIYLIIYGCLLIVVVRFVPQGLVGWIGGAAARDGTLCSSLSARHQALRRPHRREGRQPASVRRGRDPRHHRAQRRGQDHALQRHLRLLRRPTRGRCGFDGRDISGLAPHARVRARASPAPSSS